MKKRIINAILFAVICLFCILPVGADAVNGAYSATASVHLSCDVTGNARSDETFNFILIPQDGAPMPETDTVSIIKSGETDFPEITYIKAGVYEYLLKQQAGSSSFYSYDDTVYRIVIVAVNNGGNPDNGLSAYTIVVQNDETKEKLDSSPVFINSYHPDGNAPQTGDENNVQLWFVLMLISLAALFFMLLCKGRRNRKNENDC